MTERTRTVPFDFNMAQWEREELLQEGHDFGFAQPAVASPRNSYTEEIRLAGAALSEVRAGLQAAEARLHQKNTEYEEFRNAPMQWGTSRIVEEELRLMML